MMTAVFVTATGTDIGKTFIARGMIGELRARGRSVEAGTEAAVTAQDGKAGRDPILLVGQDPPVGQSHRLRHCGDVPSGARKRWPGSRRRIRPG